LEENYHQPKSQLEPYTEQLKELFKKQVPHTVNQAIEMIDKERNLQNPLKRAELVAETAKKEK
jgi:hypothetical protein